MDNYGYQEISTSDRDKTPADDSDEDDDDMDMKEETVSDLQTRILIINTIPIITELQDPKLNKSSFIKRHTHSHS